MCDETTYLQSTCPIEFEGSQEEDVYVFDPYCDYVDHEEASSPEMHLAHLLWLLFPSINEVEDPPWTETK